VVDQLNIGTAQTVDGTPTMVLSITKRKADVFGLIMAVLQKNWSNAFLNANGLSMSDLLKGMAALDRLDLADLMSQQAAFTSMVNMPRIQYAADVIRTQALPATAPGDLDATGQVQTARDYLAKHPRLIIPFDLTSTLPQPTSAPPHAEETAFQATANGLGVEVAVIHAVTDVESGAPFGSDGRPILRYELHIFYAQVVKALGQQRADEYVKTHPHLCQATWSAGERFHHGGQANEWSLLYGAMILRPGIDAGLSSPSYGGFQIVGTNFAMTGATDLRSFVLDEFVSEANQLSHFAGFVRAAGLIHALTVHDWAAFARGYNGRGFEKNHYDTNLAAAYARRTGAR
jgi:N-acetylmuramidase